MDLSIILCNKAIRYLPLLRFILEVIRFEQIRSRIISDDDYIVFGGTFDPFHQEHCEIIKKLSRYFRKIFIATTAQNVFKHRVPTDFKTRVEMIKLVLNYEEIDFNTPDSQIQLLDLEYSYSEEVVNYLRERFEGDLYWAIGDDLVGSLSSWKNWEKLNITVVSMPVIVNIHSTDVRRDPNLVHPALVEFIKDKGLYCSD